MRRLKLAWMILNEHAFEQNLDRIGLIYFKLYSKTH